jgi:hypothetical protein
MLHASHTSPCPGASQQLTPLLTCCSSPGASAAGGKGCQRWLLAGIVPVCGLDVHTLQGQAARHKEQYTSSNTQGSSSEHVKHYNTSISQLLLLEGLPVMASYWHSSSRWPGCAHAAGAVGNIHAAVQGLRQVNAKYCCLLPLLVSCNSTDETEHICGSTNTADPPCPTYIERCCRSRSHCRSRYQKREGCW